MPQISVDELIMKQPPEILNARRTIPKRNESIKSEGIQRTVILPAKKPKNKDGPQNSEA